MHAALAVCLTCSNIDDLLGDGHQRAKLLPKTEMKKKVDLVKQECDRRIRPDRTTDAIKYQIKCGERS